MKLNRAITSNKMPYLSSLTNTRSNLLCSLLSERKYEYSEITTYVCMYVCMYLFPYVRMCVCMYIKVKVIFSLHETNQSWRLVREWMYRPIYS
jgi:hypothetical protein